MSARRSRMAKQTRACLLWMLAFFALAHLGMLIATQGCWPHLRDPEFGYKLTLLRKHRAAEPNRPLLVLLGSSRTGQGMRPGVLPPLKTADGRTAFVFNFSQVGSGPLAELVTLCRLLDAGIRPDWLAIEVLPALLGRSNDACGEAGGGVSRIGWNDLRLLSKYVPDPGTMTRRWYNVQLAPWHAHRFSLMNHCAADCVPWRKRVDHWKCNDDWGWSDLGDDSQPLVLVPSALELARQTYYEELQHYHIAEMQDRALHDLLALCRREGIPTVLYLMPEGSIYRGWYAPETRACVDDYLKRLTRETGVPIVDARDWMPDKYFGDSHHLYRLGATRFTRTIGEKVFTHLVRGQLDAIRPVLVPPSETYPPQPREQGPLARTHDAPASPASPTLSINGGTPPAGPPGKSGK
ncbi:MAG TPA: hypothetical protein VH643_41680 [Gemmataceae bacterium]